MKILVIEDDKAIAQSIKKTLSSYGEIDCAYTGSEGLALAKNDIYDCIVLDIMLPEINGLEVLSLLRQSSLTPVLMLTALDQMNDKLQAFKDGADDYLTKPFFADELCARIEAILRRYNKNFNQFVLTFKDLNLNVSNHVCTINEQVVELPGKLFEMLEYLIRRVNMISTKEQIFNRIWGFNSFTAISVVEVYASNLRKILKEYDYHHYLHTIRSVGYMLKDEK